MSRFAEILKRVYTTVNHPIGFRQPSTDTEMQGILIIADISSLKAKRMKDVIAAGVDAILINPGEMDFDAPMKLDDYMGKVPLGIKLFSDYKNISNISAEQFDFIAVDLKASSEVLSKDKPGKILFINKSMTPGMVKVINDLSFNFDGVVINNENNIDIEFLLTCHLFSELLRKPLLVTFSGGNITEADLLGLNSAGIRGLIVPPNFSIEKIKTLRKAISALPKSVRKKSGESVLIPGFSVVSGKVDEREDEEIEDDE